MANKVPNKKGTNRGKFRTIKKKQKQPQKGRIVRGKVQDARQKILLKKRKTVVDARDILAKMAKSHDARSKLDKLRQGKTSVVTKNGSIKPIGTNILRKTDRNGKISLVTNKTKVSSDMNLAIRKELGLLASHQRPPVKRLAAPVKRTPILQAAKPMITKTIANPYIYETEPYKWQNSAASQVIGSLGRREEYYEPVYQTEALSSVVVPVYSRPLRISRGYIDLDAVDEDMPMVQSAPVRTKISLQGTSRISNIHSRLDTVVQPQTHGILSQAKTKVVVPAGHRIVVSNLQSTVSQEDIKELFEDIGLLLAARLVRQGVAEVIYKNLKDAQKAVDTYHNRQLDGQPMKCLLVNKRPLNNPTALPVAKAEIQQIRKVPTPNVTSNKLVPDISTIHKVLFQRK